MRTLGAIDIGTNSIKLLVANVEDDGSLEVLLREKAMVRLGSETLRTGRLSPEAIEAGASTVEHFVKLAGGSGAEVVRAVATCAVREATNSDDFVAGRQEADGRHGSTSSRARRRPASSTSPSRSEFPARQDPLFLIDIGGGSTEFVISDGSRVLLTESLPLGVVRLADRHARNDPPSDKDIAGHEEGDPRRRPSAPPRRSGRRASRRASAPRARSSRCRSSTRPPSSGASRARRATGR